MDYKEKQERYNEIVKGMGEDLKPIFDRMVEKSNEAIDKKNPVDYSEYVPPCGITKRNIPLSEEQLREADELVDQAITSIVENEDEYADFSNQIPQRERFGGKGEGGDMGRRVKVIPMEFPLWLEDLESNLKSYYKRKKSRKGLDWEEMVKGRIARAKEKIIKKDDALYVFLDTSGSMWWNTDKNGHTLLQLFGSFFPVIAQKYSGEVWQSDSAPYGSLDPITKRTLLKDFRSSDMNQDVFSATGGGATDFWGVFQYFDQKVREAKERNSDAKVMLIFFSDMDADWTEYPELIHGKEILFVTDGVPDGGEAKEVLQYVNGENIRLITTNPSNKRNR